MSVDAPESCHGLLYAEMKYSRHGLYDRERL